MAALTEADSAKALKLFRKAADAVPTNDRFKSYIKELETGEYSLDRVVLTAARMECIEKGKSKSTPKGVLARGNFLNRESFDAALKAVGTGRKFRKAKKNILQWECR